MAMAFGGLALSKIASALNRHRKGGRINHVSAPNARARRSRRAGVVELRGRRRPPPDRRSMVMSPPCARCKISGCLYPLARGCRALDHTRAGGHGAADVLFANLVGGAAGRLIAPGWRWPSEASRSAK